MVGSTLLRPGRRHPIPVPLVVFLVSRVVPRHGRDPPRGPPLCPTLPKACPMRRAVLAVLAVVTLIALGRGLAVLLFDHFPVVVAVCSALVVGVVWSHELSPGRSV